MGAGRMWASAPTAGTGPHLDVVGGDAYVAPLTAE